MRFTESHEWIYIEGDIGTVGISSHARKELGEIVFIELPAVGRFVQSAEETAVLESTKAASDVYSPVAGEIIAVNADLKNSCASINLSPEKEGWLFKLRIKNKDEAEKLMDAHQYNACVNP